MSLPPSSFPLPPPFQSALLKRGGGGVDLKKIGNHSSMFLDCRMKWAPGCGHKWQRIWHMLRMAPAKCIWFIANYSICHQFRNNTASILSMSILKNEYADILWSSNAADIGCGAKNHWQWSLVECDHNKKKFHHSLKSRELQERLSSLSHVFALAQEDQNSTSCAWIN